jgi:hypothetical protein
VALNYSYPDFTPITVLGKDLELIRRTSKVQIAAELAARYGIVDEYEYRPVSLRSLRFLLQQGLPMP